MPYAILRFQKVKAGGVSARYNHNERKKEVYKSNPDINHTAKEDNYYLVIPKNTYRREVQRMIKSAGCKVRSNSTVMVETLITASPEFMKRLDSMEQVAFFERAFEFVESKIGRDNIISAVVHMDEKTPHMHLSFCPIVDSKKGKSLSAKAILGNQATLSKWQTDYHNHMSERWPELQRGISSQETRRKHIPVYLFKSADRLDKQYTEVVKALENLNPVNAKSKRDKALTVLGNWMPEAIKFTARIKEVDSYIKFLENEKAETEMRINEAKVQADERVRSTKNTLQERLDRKDDEIVKKEKEILAVKRAEYETATKLRKQADKFERLIGRLPIEIRDRVYEEMKASNNNKISERGKMR